MRRKTLSKIVVICYSFIALIMIIGTIGMLLKWQPFWDNLRANTEQLVWTIAFVYVLTIATVALTIATVNIILNIKRLKVSKKKKTAREQRTWYSN